MTGANSGIGRATALELAKRGYNVYGTVRSTSRASKLHTAAAEASVTVKLVELDISSDQSVRNGFAEIFERAGKIDHLVNNAGVGGNGVVEETTSERLAEVFDVDLIGTVRCIRQVLPGMRERGRGTIVNISSVAGRIGAIAQAPYVAAKWALEGISEQLAIEVAPFGIRVAIVEPGITKSSIFGKNVDAPNDSEAYDEQYARMLQMYAAGYLHASDASEVGKAVLTAIEAEDDRLRYPVSWGGRSIVEGRRKMTDEEWIALGRTETMDEYVAAFERHFGIDISS